MKSDKVLNLLGLAQKAHFVASGEFMTETSVKSHSAYLVIVATDASDRTKKQMSDMCAHYRVPMCLYGDKELLGRALGKEDRASLCVTNKGMADQIIIQITEVNKWQK